MSGLSKESRKELAGPMRQARRVAMLAEVERERRVLWCRLHSAIEVALVLACEGIEPARERRCIRRRLRQGDQGEPGGLLGADLRL